MPGRPAKCYTCDLFVPLPANFQCCIALCTNPLIDAAHALANKNLRKTRNDRRYRARNRHNGRRRPRDPGRAKAYQHEYYLKHKERYRELEHILRAKLAVRARRSELWRKQYAEDVEFREKKRQQSQKYRERKMGEGMVFAYTSDGGRHWIKSEDARV